MKRLLLFFLLACFAFAANPYQARNSFNAGEVSPLIDARFDLSKYNHGCSTLENMIVLPYGGATKRPGTYYVTSTKDNGTARLIPFVYSTTSSYVIEVGNQYMRFYTNNAQITDGSNAYEIISPYLSSQIDDITYVQSADVMYIFHPDINAYKLSRLTATTFSLEEVDWLYVPYRDQNIEDISMNAQFVQYNLIGLTYDDDGGAAADYQLKGANNVFDNIIVGDLIRIINNGAGGHLTPGEYTVGSIDSTNHSYICLTTDPADNSDDTGVSIELVRYDDVQFPEVHEVGVDYKFGDAVYIEGETSDDRYFLTCVTSHTSDATNAPDDLEFGANPTAALSESNGIWYCYATSDNGTMAYDPYIERGMGVVVHSAYSDTISGTPSERAYFDSTWIGSRIKLNNYRESDAILEATVSTATLLMGPIRLKGTWWVTTNNLWTGTIRVQRSEDYGYTWETVDQYYHEEDDNSNFQGTGTEEADDIFYRVISDDDGDGTLDNIVGQLDIQFKTNHSFQPGEVEITGVASAPSLYNPYLEISEDSGYLLQPFYFWNDFTDPDSLINTTRSTYYSTQSTYTAIEWTDVDYFGAAANRRQTYAKAAHNASQNALDYSISFWMWVDETTDNPKIINKGDNYAVWIGQDASGVNARKISVYHKNIANTIAWYTTDADQINAETWQWICITFENGVGHTIYVDNTAVAGSYHVGGGYDTGVNVAPDNTDTAQLYVCGVDNGFDSMDGHIRDLCLFNTNIGSSDRTVLYHGGSIPSDEITYDGLTSIANLVSLWRMDLVRNSSQIPNERSGIQATVKDQDGDAVSDEDIFDADDFKYGTASFNLQGENYLDLSTISGSLTSAQTYTGWFKIDTALTGTNEYCLINRQAQNEDILFQVKIDLDANGDHVLKLNYDGANTASGTTTIETDTWYQVAFVDDLTNMVVYLDGTSEISEGAGDISVGYLSTNLLWLGGMQTTSLADDLFDGHFDDWAVYDEALDSTAITNISSATAVAYGKVRVPVFDADGTDESTDGKSDYTLRWNESAWSPRRGFPEHATFYDQRLTCGKGTQVWLSVTDDYENFRVGANDDEALDFTIVSRQPDPIQWLVGQNRLLIGTSGGEWVMGGSGTDEPITPSNVFCRQQSTYGSMDLEAIRVNDLILFVQRQARKVREFSYQYETDQWNAPDLSILSEHITESGIGGAAFQQQKHAILWCYRTDGDVCAMTYEKEHDVVGWHRHTFSGDVESLTTIPQSTMDDQVWMIVERTIDGSVQRHIEYLKPMTYDSSANANLFYVDSGLTTAVTASDTITGLDHLEGKVVAVIADGTVLYDGTGTDPNFTVTSGTITIATDTPTYTTVHVGLPYTATLKTLPLNYGDNIIYGRVKRINQVWLDYFLSGDFYFGRDLTHSDLLSIDGTETVMSRNKTFPPGDDNTAQVLIYQTSPEPLTLKGVSMEFQVY